MSLVTVTALPILSTNQGAQIFEISPRGLAPETPVEEVVRDTWFSTNKTVGQLRLAQREVLVMRQSSAMHGFDAIVAGTIGQFLGTFCLRHDLMVASPSAPADHGDHVGDPDFVALIRIMLRSGQVPKVAAKHTPLLKLCLALTERSKGAKKGQSVLVGMSDLPVPVAMAAGWMMASVFPENPMALRHGTSDVVCRQSIVTPPEGLVLSA